LRIFFAKSIIDRGEKVKNTGVKFEYLYVINGNINIKLYYPRLKYDIIYDIYS